jgi:hypothetical protein
MPEGAGLRGRHSPLGRLAPPFALALLFKETYVTFASRLSLLCSFGLILGLAACGDDAAPPELEPPPSDPVLPRAVIVSGDFNATGIVSVVDVTAGTIKTNVVAGAAGADPVLRRLGKELLIVNRFGPTGSRITILDSTLFVTHQLTTGASTNPQDVAVVGDMLYLPALETTGVVALQRNGLRTLIDLSALDPDGKPDCNSAYGVGDKLVITCGLLDGFAATRNGVVVIYDPATQQKTVTELAAKNPVGFLQPTPADSAFGGDLLMATADYGDHEAQCVLRINPVTGANRCAISNAELGGIANHFESDATTGALYIAPTYYEGFELRGALRTVNLSSGQVAATAWSKADHAISDLAVCPDGSVVGVEATFGASGVRIYKDGVERTAAPLSIGLPPVPQNAIVCY